jgi:tetratricopeptide (TPR) repeat protein
MIIITLLFSLAFPALAPQTFTIIGTVRNSSGQPVSSIRVSITDENFQPIRTIFTDSSGRFRLSGLASGRYLLRVEPAGMPYEEQSVPLDMQSLRIRGTGSEAYPVDIILKTKKGMEANAERPGFVFAQKVPDAARLEYEIGVNSLKDNKPDQGIAALKKAIEIFPDYYLALELLGTEYVKRGEFNPAVPVLTRALEVNQAAPKTMYALGVAHLKLNQAAEAIKLLKTVAELESNNINAHLMLGIALGNHGELQASEVAFKKAYQLGGDQAADAHLYLAGLYNKQEKYNEAVKELELYLKEAKDIKDRAPIRAMIDKLKEKQKAKGQKL